MSDWCVRRPPLRMRTQPRRRLTHHRAHRICRPCRPFADQSAVRAAGPQCPTKRRGRRTCSADRRHLRNRRAGSTSARIAVTPVDGVVSVASRLSNADLTARAAQTPLVLVNRRCASLPSVVIDLPSGIARVLDHLADLGHSHIAYIFGPARTWMDEQRRRRVRERARLYGLQIEMIRAAPPAFPRRSDRDRPGPQTESPTLRELPRRHRLVPQK